MSASFLSSSLIEDPIVEGILFRGIHLCIPNTSLRDYLIWEMHAGGATGHFDRDKTTFLIEDKSSRLSVKRDVTSF